MRSRIGPTTLRTLDGVRHLAGSFWRTGRRSVVLGGLLLAASAVTVLGTTNSPPVFTSLTLSTSVLNEGETVTLTGAFTDPNAGDGHTVLIYWNGEESDVKQKVQLPAGQSTFQVSHVPGDSLPSPRLKVIIFDHELPFGSNDNTTGGMMWDSEFLPFTVKNVAPRLPGPNTVTSSRSAAQVRVTIDGPIADGAGDTHQVRAAKWYGSTPAKVFTPCTASNLRFHCELTYSVRELGSEQVVTVYVKDDEGAAGAANVSVSVGDAPDA